MEILPIAFDDPSIRRMYNEDTDTWWYAVIDVVQVLTQQPDDPTACKYWKKLKRRFANEGSQVVTSCHRLTLPTAGGKQQLTEVATAETLLRVMQSVPSPKAEPIKLWLAKMGFERMQEMADPALSLNRARQTWQQQGRSAEWIQQRMTGHETRNMLTDYWTEHDINKGREFDTLTNIIHQAWAGVSVAEHKDMKGLTSHNLRDHMSEAELIFAALAELSTRQIAESVEATGVEANKCAAEKGGRIAAQARHHLESKTGKSVVTGANYLSPVVKSKIVAIKARAVKQSRDAGK